MLATPFTFPLVLITSLVIACTSPENEAQHEKETAKPQIVKNPVPSDDKKKFAEVASEHLKQRIKDSQVLSAMRFDTVIQNGSNMVLFHVNNSMQLNDWNLLVVFVNDDFSVDTVNSAISEEKIAMHIRNPEKNKLYLTKQKAEQIAAAKGLEKGVKPWKVQLIDYNADRTDIRWSIQNTMSFSEYEAEGQGFSIKIANGKYEHFGWNMQQ